MKFDNAFKTKAGTVGLQYKDKDQLLTVYKDQEGKHVVSEDATPVQAAQLTINYDKFAHRYG